MKIKIHFTKNSDAVLEMFKKYNNDPVFTGGAIDTRHTRASFTLDFVL